METVKAECTECNGTGLYSGCAEPKGTAVVCIICKGTGCDEIYFKPFTRKKGRRGIQTIDRWVCGSLVGRVSYREFQEGKMP